MEQLLDHAPRQPFDRRAVCNHVQRGFQLSEKGLRRAIKAPGGGSMIATGPYLDMPTESDIFSALGLRYVEPHERNDKFDLVDEHTGEPCYQLKQPGASKQLGCPSWSRPPLALPTPAGSPRAPAITRAEGQEQHDDELLQLRP